MDFSNALSLLKQGQLLGRTTWAGQWVCRQKAYPEGIAINANTAEATGLPQGSTCRFNPYLMLCQANGTFEPYAPTQADLFAVDWELLPKPATKDPEATPVV